MVEVKEIVCVNPATLEEFRKVPNCREEDVRIAVGKARKAFDRWKAMNIKDRINFILKFKTYLTRNINEVVELLSTEKGTTRVEVILADIFPTLEVIDYYSKNAERLLKRRKLCVRAILGGRSYVEFEPYGLIGIIAPWNFPLSIPISHIVPALIAGNVCILKPSEYTPLSGVEIGKIFREVGLPEGVFEVVTGDGVTGSIIVDYVDKVFFTGSTATGRKIMAKAVQRLIPVVMELGGKDPMIVFEEVDIDLTTSAALYGGFFNTGQVCASVERVYVHESIYDDFLRMLVDKVKKIKVGVGDVDMGALISPAQLEKVVEQVEEAKRRGAKVLVGGEKIETLKGYFFEPTIIVDVDHTFKVVKEETFGPVLPVMKFRDEDEAIALANDSIYGLTASIWTKDMNKARRVAEKLEFATVMINDNLNAFSIVQAPWGGIKESGTGYSHGEWGLYETVRIKHIREMGMGVKHSWYYPLSGKYEIVLDALKMLHGDLRERVSGFLRFMSKVKGVKKL